MRPLMYKSSNRKKDWVICGLGWLLVCLCCLPFPLLRNFPSHNSSHPVCFLELPLHTIDAQTSWVMLILAELFGFIIPLVLVLACTCMTAMSLRDTRAEAIPDRGEKRRALRMLLVCAVVFLVCFVPYHVTMPLDFMIKNKVRMPCDVQELIQLWHTVALCLASINCSLDPLMYYFTTDEFWRRLSEPEVTESIGFNRRLSCITRTEDEEVD